MQTENSKSNMIMVEREKINVEYENDPKKYMSNGKFDAVTFNKDFGIILTEKLIEAERIEENKLNEYNAYYNALAEENERKKKYESTINSLTLSKILVKWGDTLKNIIADIIKGNYSAEEFIYIFVKDDRLIYLGMTLILIGMLGYIINQYLLEYDINGTIAPKINVVTNNYLSETPKAETHEVATGVAKPVALMDIKSVNAVEQLKKM
jgi:hypothetical protein